MNSTENNFEKKKEAFIQEYKEFFSDAYLKRLMERLEKNVLNPALLTDSISTTWTNNDGKFSKLKRLFKSTFSTFNFSWVCELCVEEIS